MPGEHDSRLSSTASSTSGYMAHHQSAPGTPFRGDTSSHVHRDDVASSHTQEGINRRAVTPGY